MGKIKKTLKRVFKRPVLAFANWLESILIKIDKWLNGLSIEEQKSLSKYIVYPFFFVFILIVFIPYIYMLFNFISTIGGN